MFTMRENENSLHPTSSDFSDPINSELLFAGCTEIKICHEGKLYRLRITKNKKLILNK